MTPKHTLTNESLSVILEGKSYTLRRGEKNFAEARAAIFTEQWDALPRLLSAGLAIERWLNGHFKVVDNLITYKGEKVDPALNDRMLKLADEGADPSGWLMFYERLQANPSYRSVNQLYAFLTHEGIPIDEKNGFILAYKSVTADYKDFHTRQFDNRPGVTNEMPRNRISDDPKVACHEGFHVGALGYARGFGSDKRIVICKVDPADVVCVPYDSSAMKVRVCKYTVIGNYSGEALPSTSFRDDDDAPALRSPVDAREDSNRPANQEQFYVEERNGEYWVLDGVNGTEEYGPITAEQARVECDRLNQGEEEEERESIGESIAIAVATVTGAAPASLPSDSPWLKYDAMDEEALSEVLFPDLRKYARHALLIIGASKMQGTKLDLVKRILQVRGKRDGT